MAKFSLSLGALMRSKVLDIDVKQERELRFSKRLVELLDALQPRSIWTTMSLILKDDKGYWAEGTHLDTINVLKAINTFPMSHVIDMNITAHIIAPDVYVILSLQNLGGYVSLVKVLDIGGIGVKDVMNRLL